MVTLTVQIIADGHSQKDGRTYVTELHADGVGVAAIIEYLAAIGADRIAIAAARSAALAISLADQEALDKLAIDAMPVLRFQTGPEFLQRLRALFRASSADRCARIARWIAHRIDAGDVTAAQLRTVFGLTAGQWTTLEAKMRSLAADADAIDQAVGE